ncbi:uncharacterized protein LOC127253499 [Andrographis paniculata]|uniref:uncharacterized protein LOC127253499 n=1 Tax=Andrographis paniculata TaxID=175694 RepID=UPI0021E7787E|nr:uncharacterized protein LOC127253499 [Andrographis paniculata]
MPLEVRVLQNCKRGFIWPCDGCWKYDCEVMNSNIRHLKHSDYSIHSEEGLEKKRTRECEFQQRVLEGVEESLGQRTGRSGHVSSSSGRSTLRARQGRAYLTFQGGVLLEKEYVRQCRCAKVGELCS